MTLTRLLTTAAPGLLIAGLLIAGAGVGCDSDSSPAAGTATPSSAPVSGGPDEIVSFGLVDANPNSATVNASVTPKDYLGKVSGWYFTHAT